MKKTATPFTAQLVTFDTTLPFDEVIARLNAQVNKAGSTQFLAQFRNVSGREEIEELINGALGPSGFLYFFELNHDQWMNIYDPSIHRPHAVVYTIGNPLIAETIMRHDAHPGYNIPPRLMVLEKPDHSGTEVVYHLPSSVMLAGYVGDDVEVKTALEGLDEKLDRLVTRITDDQQ
ncbi:hypothetical protein Hypma_010260 [Hypsizygus marmoreus]|uniref:DUF302 domain-containing protein n=1 Tax=Hypsizygus marmoreus TaxID=39966 RepID=A0A369JUN0_HYPMA|nr:hypothetical protein Hypma_010260 [Hypsizygus marmoreus]